MLEVTRSALVLVVLVASIARAQAVDPTLARGRVIASGGPASFVAITLDAPPAPAALALLDRYGAPATFFVRASAWDDAWIDGVEHVDADLGLRMERATDVVAALERAARAGHPLGMFRGRDARAAAKRLGLSEVPAGLAITRANAVARVRALSRGGVIVRVAPDALAPMLEELERLNCERRARAQPPITPVSLHYFVRDGNRVRPVPDDVALRTSAYAARLADRCEDRGRVRGDVPHRPRFDNHCAEDPLGKGCL
jgi:hypothetical protein